MHMRKFGTVILSFILAPIYIGCGTPGNVYARWDKIAAVVGSSIILQSDIELKYASYLAAGNAPSQEIKCEILQSLLTQKLLAQQAVIDGVDVKDDEVDGDVDRRMRGSIQEGRQPG